MVPCSSRISSASIAVTCPRRTTLLDAAELRELAIAERGAVVGGRRHGGIEASQLARRLQSCEDVVDRVGESDRLHLIGEALCEHGEELVAGLEVGAVQHPGVPRHDPRDAVGVDPVVEHPDAGVHRRLAGADHDERVVVRRHSGECVERHARDLRRDGVRRRRRRRDLHLRVGRVDEASGVDRALLARQQRRDGSILTDLAHREEAHASRRQEPLPHHEVEVAEHLVAGGELVEAGVGTDLLDATRAERRGADSVEARGLMQTDERIGVVPMSAGTIVAIDHDDRGVGLGEHRVGERHPRRAGPHDEVVGGDRRRSRRHCVSPA